MKISVVVCSHFGGEKCVHYCLDSLAAQNRKPNETILVFDTDEECKEFWEIAPALWCNWPFLDVIASGKTGLAAARNKGVEVSKGDIIVFIDDDAKAPSNWLVSIEKIFSESANVAVVGGPVQPLFEGNPIDQSLNWLVGCTSEDPAPVRPIGCNMAIRRKTFERVGMFDESLDRGKHEMGISEETELFLRIDQQLPKSCITFDRSVVVDHVIPASRTKFLHLMKRAFAEGRVKFRLGRKYPQKVERSYLTYYLENLNLFRALIILAVGFGYVRGRLW